uniref:BZIP domain-containing protein n=2 Tax=Schistosoma mansoni TaxID=6183 RepID=A0A3Q0KTX1_SCHMA
MHTAQKRYCTQNQPTTVTTDSSINQMENEDWNRFLENDFTKLMGITSQKNYPFNDQSTICIPNDTSTTSTIINNNNIPITYKMNDNKNGSVIKNILGHVKELQKNYSNDNNREITPNCDCSDNDLSWTKDVFNSNHYATGSLALTSVFINDTKMQNNHPVSNEFIFGEEYQQSNYLYDQHFNSSPVQLCSQTDYSVMRTLDYPYIVNNEHPHYLSEHIQSSDTEYLNYHNNLHMDLRSNVSDFTDTSIASNPDNQNRSESKAKSSIMFLNDHLCEAQAPTIENLKSCNRLSHPDSFEDGWLDGQNSIHHCANWSVDWTNNTESSSRSNYHSSNSKHIPINFDSFRCLGATSYIGARSPNCKKDCLATKNSESVDHSYKGVPNLSSNHQFDSGPKLCNEFGSSLSPQSESTKLCNVISNTVSEVPIPNAFNLSSGAYFWLYNSQCKGPKASPLISLTNTMILNNSGEDDQSSLTENCPSNVYQDDFVSSSASSRAINPIIHYPISPLSLPGYPFVVFEDPVQRRYDLVHCSKLRRGDGNDVTPNLMRLRSMGEELAHLNKNITAQGELIAAGASSVLDQSDNNVDFKIIQDFSGSIFNSKIVEQAKREKNKLASKICRLKKKAFHEANKIKYLGLEIEYNELASVIVKIKELITKALRNNLPPENFRYELASQQHFYMSENQLNKVDLSSSSHAGSISLAQSTVKLFPNISGSVFKQALLFYETTHVTRTAERMDILVDEVIQNYSFPCPLSSSRTDLFERDNQSLTSNRKYYTPLLQALTNSNMYCNNHDGDKSPDSRNSNAIFHEAPEINKANDIQQDTQKQQCPSTSKLNYPRPPPEFKLIYE